MRGGPVKLAGEEDDGTVVRLDERRVELRPESTNEEHKPRVIGLQEQDFEICGVVVGALIGDGCNDPDCDLLSA